jgi:ADP-ribose pyrophosphatase YjhB (NUDIX family)
MKWTVGDTRTIPGDDSGAVLLLYRHRFITDRWGWEIPAGSADPGEDAPAAAARELAEETGLTCRHLEPLGRADLSNGLTDRHVQIYRATRLAGTPQTRSTGLSTAMTYPTRSLSWPSSATPAPSSTDARVQWNARRATATARHRPTADQTDCPLWSASVRPVHAKSTVHCG